MRKVLVDKNSGLIVNAIEIEEGASWQPPEGCILLPKVASQDCDIGDTWDALAQKVIKRIKTTIVGPSL